MKQKIQTLLTQMNHGLVEREEAIKTALLTMLAGENLVLIGPPGTGKSMIARRIAEILETHQDAGYFEYLLTKFSTPIAGICWNTCDLLRFSRTPAYGTITL